MFEVYLKESLLMIGLFSGIPLLISSVAGLTVAVVQAATQIQEQSISHLVRFLAVVVVIALLGPWFMTEMTQFIQTMISSTVLIKAI